jgi:uncharacterized membrane protein YgcG
MSVEREAVCNKAFVSKAGGGKSTVLCQVERNEGSDADYTLVMAPKGLKMQACIDWYSNCYKEGTAVHFTTWEELFGHPDPVATFELLFTTSCGKRTVIGVDFETVATRKLGTHRGAVALNTMVQRKMGVFQSLSIQLLFEFHSHGSPLRPHFQIVYLNGTLHTDKSYEKLKKHKDINVPIKTCVQFVMDMNPFKPQELPHLGTDKKGSALAVKTPDGFVTLADREKRWLRITENGNVQKGCGDYQFMAVNKDAVQVDTRVRPQKLGTTRSAEGVEAHHTLLPPGESFCIARYGQAATPGTSDSMVDGDNMCGITFWKSKAAAAQFAGILPPLAKRSKLSHQLATPSNAQSIRTGGSSSGGSGASIGGIDTSTGGGGASTSTNASTS